MTSRAVLRLTPALAAAVLAAAIPNSGLAAPDVAQTRSTAGFDRVRVEGAFRTVITAGSPTTRVVIAGDPGTVERVTTRVDGGTLVVGMRKGEWETTHAPRVTIEVPVLHGFAESGAGTTTVSGLTGGDVELSISGAGTMTASGRAARLTVTLGGAAKIDTTALAARDVTVENDGVGVAKVRADGSLDATINGVGVVRYTGRVRDVQQHINGIGSIERI